MKSKIQFLVVALPLLLAAGCSTNYEPIYFASEAKMPTPPPDSTVRIGGLSKEDEKKIQMVIFNDLLGRHFWEGGDYSALFIQADDDVVDKLIQKYPNHVPPIKQSWHIDLRSNQSPMDKDTGRPVMILGADVGEPNADGAVDAIGRWYAGGAVQGFYTFSMKKTGDDWTIASVK